MPSERGWKNSVEAIAATADVAKDCGVELALEVVNRFESNLLNTTAQGLKFLKATGRDDVFLHLDTFHMNIEEANPAAAIRLAGDKLAYYHIGENYRGYLGTGWSISTACSMRSLDIGYDRDIVFESSPARSSTKACRSPAASGATPGPTTCRWRSTPRPSSS